ncbi:MAG: (d)CMP kinase [Betaproteobacteria bacterium]|nr:(d)CMP kinase [Betaproteobacteria bacterium]
MSIPVIAIDGPSASGKGTIAAIVAQRLGFAYLDSGAIYRVAAYAALQQGVDLSDEPALVELAGRLDLRFDGAEVYLDGQPVGDAIRTEEAGRAASTIAVLPRLREALLARQRAFRQAPGLAADGRDMGTVVFPDASVKVFLTASAEERANRRYKQLIEKGLNANLSRILQDLQERDARDAARTAAPMQHAPDAVLIDTTGMTIEAVVQQVLGLYRQALGNEAPKAQRE